MGLWYYYIVQLLNLRRTSMSLESHIESLNTKVNNLEGRIHEAYVHHLPTVSLKKERLLYLDAIQQLMPGYDNQNAA